jgi:hypothetical protein
VRGASDATYLISSFGDELLMQLQLNIHRLVIVYRVPALDALDADTLAVRLERWRIGAEHAGWKFGWRNARSSLLTKCALKQASMPTLHGGSFSNASLRPDRLIFLRKAIFPSTPNPTM